MILRSAALIFLVILIAYVLQVYNFTAFTNSNDNSSNSDGKSPIDQELGPKLSSKASIVHYTSAAPRWSEYYPPKPGTIVNVAHENDVVETVRYCIENNLDFLAQSGGHSWVTTFTIGQKDVLINMRGLNQVTVSEDKANITIGGGTLVSELVEGAYQNDVFAVVPACNCVGVMGATLGGGFNLYVGSHGFVMDNLLSVDLVTAEGNLITVSPTSYPDLWWGLRGAGQNFGVVTSAVFKAHPPIAGNNRVWTGSMTFNPEKLEDLVQIVTDLDYPKETYLTLIFAALPPALTPTVLVNVWYAGPEAEGKATFKALYDLGPATSIDQVVPYNKVNAPQDPWCQKGNRAPGYGVMLSKLDPKAFREVWNEYTSFVARDPALLQTSTVVELYPTEKSTQFDSAFPYRGIKSVAVLLQSVRDPKFDEIARESGRKIRSLWAEGSGLDEFQCYVNYGYGDESLEAVYGKSLPRLKELKKVWDKHGRFNQVFPIPTS